VAWVSQVRFLFLLVSHSVEWLIPRTSTAQYTPNLVGDGQTCPISLLTTCYLTIKCVYIQRTASPVPSTFRNILLAHAYVTVEYHAPSCIAEWKPDPSAWESIRNRWIRLLVSRASPLPHGGSGLACETICLYAPIVRILGYFRDSTSTTRRRMSSSDELLAARDSGGFEWEDISVPSPPKEHEHLIPPKHSPVS